MERVRLFFGLLAVISLLPLGSCYRQEAGGAVSNGPLPPDVSAPVRQQIERLHSFDPVVRRNAAQELGKMGELAAPALPSLIAALSDSARVVLPSRGGETSSPSVAEASMEALVRIGAPAVGPLIFSLQDPNPGVRMMAAEALGKIEDPRTVDPLVQVLEGDGDYQVQAAAVDALRKKKDPRAVEAFLLAEKHESWVVRSLAKRALEEAGTDQGDEGLSSPGEAVPSEEPQPVQRQRGEGVDARKGEERGTAEIRPPEADADAALGKEEGRRTETAPELTHIVEQGDTLYSLGRRYGVPWRVLMEHNHLHDPVSLCAGQILRIPEAAEEKGPRREPLASGTTAGVATDGERSGEQMTHIVKEGETLYSLGRRYGVPWQTLMAYNDLQDPTSLHAGQILKVRVADGVAGGIASEGETLYKVQEGDNLYEIGLLFGMSWKCIAERNGLTEPDEIFVGQVLRIPGRVHVPSP
jgi:LysM repeat protein